MTQEKFLAESTSDEDEDAQTFRMGVRNQRNARTVVKEKRESSS